MHTCQVTIHRNTPQDKVIKIEGLFLVFGTILNNKGKCLKCLTKNKHKNRPTKYDITYMFASVHQNCIVYYK